MLKTLKISNYRGFKEYSISKLGRVNLLVGKNNSGKTSILEAVHLIASRGNHNILYDILKHRNEFVLTNWDESERFPERSVDPGYFFPYQKQDIDSPFRVSGLNNSEQWIQGQFSEIENNKQTKLYDRDSTEIEFEITSSYGERYSIPLDLAGGIPLRRRRRQLLFREGDTGYGSIFVPTVSLSSSDMYEMWDHVLNDGLEDDVRDQLRILDPDVNGVFFFSSAGRVGRPMIRHSKWEEPFPLGSMGEGMKRMLALAIAAIRAKGGVLIVDEIDTGLHYSVLRNMWKLVIETCSRLDVQLFATTHSDDCVQALSGLCQVDSDVRGQAMLHRIQADKQQAVTLDGETIVETYKRDLEVR